MWKPCWNLRAHLLCTEENGNTAERKMRKREINNSVWEEGIEGINQSKREKHKNQYLLLNKPVPVYTSHLWLVLSYTCFFPSHVSFSIRQSLWKDSIGRDFMYSTDVCLAWFCGLFLMDIPQIFKHSYIAIEYLLCHFWYRLHLLSA